jgi:hypothetical protein
MRFASHEYHAVHVQAKRIQSIILVGVQQLERKLLQVGIPRRNVFLCFTRVGRGNKESARVQVSDRVIQTQVRPTVAQKNTYFLSSRYSSSLRRSPAMYKA